MTQKKKNYRPLLTTTLLDELENLEQEDLPPDVAVQSATPEDAGLVYSNLDMRKLAGCLQRCMQLEQSLSRISPAGQTGLVDDARAGLTVLTAELRKVLGD